MTPSEHAARFLERFEGIRHRMRRTGLAAVLCWLLLGAVVAIALLAWIDFRFEDAWRARAVRLGALAAAFALIALRSAIRIVRRWGRPETSAELERRFPELGQRIRTAVQYARQSDEHVRQAGVMPTMVTALQQETDERSAPLALDTVVPVRRLRLAAGLAGLCLVALLLSALLHWEWRTSLRRTLLSRSAYTTLVVTPGNAAVNSGDALPLDVTLSGRTDRQVTLQTRPAGRTEAKWSSEELSAVKAADPPLAGAVPPGSGRSSPRLARFSTRLRRLTEPLEYRVVAGPEASSVYRIDVRHPLAIRGVTSVVTPPSYTGLAPRTNAEGDVSALRGSHAKFQVELDGVPASAHVELTPLAPASAADSAQVERRAAHIDGPRVAFELDLDRDLKWTLSAVSTDGLPLPRNAYRITVRDDQAPRVSFVEPQDELEVHTLAEVLMQVRASDDYGLARSGIVFAVDNDQEYPLLEEDFEAAAQALAEAGQSGNIAPRTRAALERILPLEHFALTQRDCVMYYAFAEDNFPDGPQRTESELRFIDIRPFKTIYRLPDDEEPGMGGQDRDLVALDELIRRQRFALNRTVRLEKFPSRWGDGELNTIERLIDYQTGIAEATRELATFLEGEGTDGADVLFQAEGAMRMAVDSLSVAQYATAVLQEKDAQQFLVEARNRLEVSLGRANGQARSAIRQFNRSLAQKLRRPRDDDEAERQIVERLQRLAYEEQEIAGGLMALAAANSASGGGGGGEMPPEEPASPGETPNAGSASGPNPPDEQPANTDGADAPQAEADSPDPQGAATPPPDPTEFRQDLEDRQADVVTEAADVRRVLDEMPDVSDLARQRMAAALETADAASTALVGSELPRSAEAAQAAGDRFRELARHVAGLLAGETARQVAMSRDLAAEIGFRTEDLANELDAARPSGGALSSGEPTDARAGSADPVDEGRALDEAGLTLQDLLQNIARSDNADGVAAQDRVAELLESEDVARSFERLAALPKQVADLQSAGAENVVEVRDLGEGMKRAAIELDRLYRSLVTPRLEELKQLEQELALLDERLPRLETPADVGTWQGDLQQALDEIEQQGAGGEAAAELRRELNGAGEGVGTSRSWTRGRDGYFMAPPAYHARLLQLAASLQRQMQELVLADLQSARDEATPPQYQALVDRYLEVLAKGAAHE